MSFSREACVLPDLKKGIPALQKLKLNAIIRRISEEKSGETAAPEKTDGTAEGPEMLPFGDWAEASAPEELTAWLEKHPGPVCLHVGERQATAATEQGDRLKIALGGDLLTPGLDPLEVLRLFSPVLAQGRAVVHGGKELLHLLDKSGLPVPDRFVWDTMLGAYLMNPQEKSYRLGALGRDWEEDACAVCSLWVWQREKITAEGMDGLMQRVEMPLSHTLFRMEREGFAVDADYLRELGKEYTEEIARRRKEVIEACGQGEFNLNSTQQLGEVLFERLNLFHGRGGAGGPAVGRAGDH